MKLEVTMKKFKGSSLKGEGVFEINNETDITRKAI